MPQAKIITFGFAEFITLNSTNPYLIIDPVALYLIRRILVIEVITESV